MYTTQSTYKGNLLSTEDCITTHQSCLLVWAGGKNIFYERGNKYDQFYMRHITMMFVIKNERKNNK